VPQAEAILLVRLDGVGDAALCVPALEGLACAFPQARFGAVCSPGNAALFSKRVERVHVYRAGQRAGELGRELRDAGYMKALIATEEVAGYELARASGARERAGFWHRLHKPFKSLWQRAQLTAPVYRPAAQVKTAEHEVQALYRLAVALGAALPPPADGERLRTWFEIEPSPPARSAAGAIGFQISPKLLGCAPVSAFARAVQTTLATLREPRGVLIASAADENLARAIRSQMASGDGELQVEVIASLPLVQWVGVLDALAVLVTPDTGAAHVAGMLGRSVIDVFDAKDFKRLYAQWHPWAGSWRCHAKPSFTMPTDAETYGRFLASQIRELRSNVRRDPAPAHRTP
jgi:ADP-heptose:LPS heptosyltransferase